MAQSRLLNELKSLLLELRSVPSAGRLTHPKVHMRVTKSGPSSQSLVRPRALPPISAAVFSIVVPSGACRWSGWCNTDAAPEVCAPARRDPWYTTCTYRGALGIVRRLWPEAHRNDNTISSSSEFR